ncbi:MAG: hypothetical protein AMXMBFR36_00240 [Acidobacteriota bacterium]
MHDRRGAVARHLSLGAALCATLGFLVSPLAAGSDAGEPLTSFHREWVWSTAQSVSGVGGLEVVDLDHDGSGEILATQLSWTDVPAFWTDGRWLEVRFSDPLEVAWTSLPYAEGLRRVRTIEIEGRSEVAVFASPPYSSSAPARIYVHDGASKALLGHFPVAAGAIRAAVVADLDASGSVEVAFCNEDAFHVYDYASGAPVASKEGFTCSDLDVGQVDSDPQLEIALAGNGLGGFVLDGSSLEVQWADLSGFGAAARFVDVDQDGSDEIVAGRDDEPALRAVEPGTGEVRWEIGEQFRALTSGDLDSDGVDEIVVGMYTLRTFDSSTGELVSEIAIGEVEIFALAVGDVDGDGNPEILATAYRDPGVAPHLVIADVAAGQVEASAGGLPGPFLAIHGSDVDADGDRDLMTATERSWGPLGSDANLVRFDVSNRAIEWVREPLPGGNQSTSVEVLALAQIDTDPQREICFSATTYSPTSSRIRCEDGATLDVEWQTFLSGDAMPTAMLAADIDGVPGTEIVVGLDDGSVALLEGGDGQLRWRSESIAPAPPVSVLRSGVVRPGAGPELVALLSQQTGVLAILSLEDGSITGGPWFVSAGALDLAFLDADPEEEIVLGDHLGEVTVCDPGTGQQGPPLAALSEAIVALRIEDSTRDGVADLHAVAGNRLVVRELVEGGEEWVSAPIGLGAGASERMTVGELDGDPLVEVAVATDYGFAIFEGPYHVLFVDGFESGDTSAWTATQP